MLNTTLVALPKIDLHCHLDGSLRPTTVYELGLQMGLIDKAETLKTLTEALEAPMDCDSLDTYLERFNLPIALMQNESVLERVTYELFEDAAMDGICYLEFRFAPHLHTRKGLSLDQVIKSVLLGMRRATEKYEIRGNCILSHLRHHSPEAMLDLIEAGVPYLNNGVVAVDLCGSENPDFVHRFIEPVNKAREYGYNITMHAGETGIGQNVIDVITLLGAKRIGHGVAIKDHPEAYDLVKSTGTVIESCPTSNLQTKAVTKIGDHPINQFYMDDLSVMVNTDNRTVSQTNMTQEYTLLSQSFGWDLNHFKRIFGISVEASFTDEKTREWLHKRWETLMV